MIYDFFVEGEIVVYTVGFADMCNGSQGTPCFDEDQILVTKFCYQELTFPFSFSGNLEKVFQFFMGHG